MSWLKEFRDFAIKGNALDLAIGVIIGTAFSKIVSSLVADIIMPPLGLLLGKVDFKDFHFTLQKAHDGLSAITLNYGAFIQNVVDFIIIAIVIFITIKFFNTLRNKQEEEKQNTPVINQQEVLLAEIRDLLKQQVTNKQ